jgi:hypothetical protein
LQLLMVSANQQSVQLLASLLPQQSLAVQQPGQLLLQGSSWQRVCNTSSNLVPPATAQHMRPSKQ